MRILTVRQPWAWALIHGGKDVENRPRNIAGGYRGPVAIHAGKNFDYERPSDQFLAEYARRPVAGRETGFIIGVVDLVDVHSASVIGGCGRMQNDCDEHPNGCRHHCSQWAMGPSPDGWYQHLVFENPRPLADPIPYKGALGLRRLDDDTIARINEGLS
ncbi:hypothetical protein [Microbacterium maritypicum]|uniref:hypothetical protein n=1 Tax=Microbacterium maritypicum TaxID=33918 RepID=UPI0037F43F71